MSNDVAETLRQRGAQYGPFVDHAIITQNIKFAFSLAKNWKTLDADAKEALEMIAHKIGRILAGNPRYADSWHDIAGYAKLVEDRLTGKDSNAPDTSEARRAVEKREGVTAAVLKSTPVADGLSEYEVELLQHTFAPVNEVIFKPGLTD